MELKPYQQEVINDLALFLETIQETKNVADAFYDFWSTHPKTPLLPFVGKAIEPYKNNIPQVPHVCVKVPTAGGKTFIACNAIKTIYDAFHYDQKNAVVWLVPSITILDQTIKNLKNTNHPYRQKINSHFGNKVEVYDKQALLQGSSFNATSVMEQLSIFVLSFDSLRAKNKEDRKVFQENGNLQSFSTMLGREEDISLMRVIQSLNPVLIVDESHNAESDLSVEMLKNLNPCFILDLTATPRKNSNIISFVDAMALKKENMVKLPVIVYNHQDKTEVINSALQLQRKLEQQAREEEKNGGRYIRPMVLFQAQPKNASDNTTFEKLKEKLIELKIPAEQIKIKTANINEIKDVDLTSKECPVRYIITVNALKEGWDCPFAYILASLADKSSAVDVEQILGRVLRQPYVTKHNSALLNLCYVLTASSKFLDTLDNIVKGLNKAGFSSKDFKVAESVIEETKTITDPLSELTQAPKIDFDEPVSDITADIDASRISDITSEIKDEPIVNEIEQTAFKQEQEYQDIIFQLESRQSISLPSELQSLVKTYRMKEVFAEQASQIQLPQFYIKKPSGEIFSDGEHLLSEEDLLEGFQLSKCDSNIAFDSVTSELYKVDLDETQSDYTPGFVKLDGGVKDKLMDYILDPSRKESRVKNLTAQIMNIIGNMYPITEHEIKKYIHKLVEDFTDEQYHDFLNHHYSYTSKIKEKIKQLSSVYAEQKFRDYLDTDKVFIKPAYNFQKEIIPGNTGKDITKSLYEKEAEMNGFEEKVINEIANLSNIAFWTRNISKKQFKINAFQNHYPDFIIHTKSGKTIVLESKGDDRDNSDSEAKIRLGKAWERKAGNHFKYFMVFDKKEVADAHTLDGFLKLVKDI
ncbi:MAG: type restriction protein res subunit [Bacteroidetes bacterium]|jgi:type III restriction enzyme|nr:type restriction protein res subunit [Bacteroidota bacterium]MDF2452385.1 type restriction protein res subunit [Bacteroidota bacterium]